MSIFSKFRLKKLCKKNRISKADLDRLLKQLIFGKTLEELQEMISPENNGKLPVIVIYIASALIRDMKSGSMETVNAILDRVWGKEKKNNA